MALAGQPLSRPKFRQGETLGPLRGPHILKNMRLRRSMLRMRSFAYGETCSARNMDGVVVDVGICGVGICGDMRGYVDMLWWWPSCELMSKLPA